MSDERKQISKILIIHTVSKFLVTGISIISAPIFTRLLSPFDYGQLATYQAWTSFLLIFVGLRTKDSIAIMRVKQTEQEFHRYLSNAMSVSFISFLLFQVLLSLFSRKISSALGFNTFLIYLLPCYAFSSYCIEFYTYELILQKEVIKSMIISGVQAVSTITLSLLFVLYNIPTNENYANRIIATFIVLMLLGGSSFTYIMCKGKSLFYREYWRFCLVYSLPLVLHGASGVIFTQSDKIFIKLYIGESEAGIYSVVCSMVSIIEILKGSFSSIWESFYYDFKSKNDTNLKSNATSYLQNFVFLTCAFLLTAPELYKILAPASYWSGITFIPILVAAFFFNFLYTFPSLYEFYNKKTGAISIISFIVAVFNIILDLLLIKKYGCFGVAIATMLSFLLAFVLHNINIVYIMKAEDYEYEIMFFMKPIFIIFCFIVIFYFLINLYVYRWLIAVILVLFLLIKFKRNKSFI